MNKNNWICIYSHFPDKGFCAYGDAYGDDGENSLVGCSLTKAFYPLTKTHFPPLTLTLSPEGRGIIAV
jgi:hypothetical protein